MGKVAGVGAAHLQAVSAQSLHHRGSHAPRAPAAGGGVDDEAHGSGHRDRVEPMRIVGPFGAAWVVALGLAACGSGTSHPSASAGSHANVRRDLDKRRLGWRPGGWVREREPAGAEGRAARAAADARAEPGEALRGDASDQLRVDRDRARRASERRRRAPRSRTSWSGASTTSSPSTGWQRTS